MHYDIPKKLTVVAKSANATGIFAASNFDSWPPGVGRLRASESGFRLFCLGFTGLRIARDPWQTL
jgi:hypothetical protein